MKTMTILYNSKISHNIHLELKTKIMIPKCDNNPIDKIIFLLCFQFKIEIMLNYKQNYGKNWLYTHTYLYVIQVREFCGWIQSHSNPWPLVFLKFIILEKTEKYLRICKSIDFAQSEEWGWPRIFQNSVESASNYFDKLKISRYIFIVYLRVSKKWWHFSISITKTKWNLRCTDSIWLNL